MADRERKGYRDMHQQAVKARILYCYSGMHAGASHGKAWCGTWKLISTRLRPLQAEYLYPFVSALAAAITLSVLLQ
jgi:hypothetical protein